MGFIAEKCELHPGKSVPKTVLFAVWRQYARATDAQFMTYDNFFNALYAAAGERFAAESAATTESRSRMCGASISRSSRRPNRSRLLADKYM